MKTNLAAIPIALLLIGTALFAQQNPIQIDANGLTQTFGAGGIVTRGQIVKINSSGQVVPVLTTDTSGAIGIAATSQQNVGQVVAVSIAGSPLVLIDSSGCTAGNVVSFSTTAGGSGHCASTASGQQVGVALSISSPGSNFWNVSLSLGGGGGGGASPTAIYVTAAPYNAKFDVQYAFSPSCTNLSQTITTGANDPPFKSSDLNKAIAGVSAPNIAANCPPQGIITAINNAHSVQVSNAATVTVSGSGQQGAPDLGWGTDDGPALQSANTAMLASTNTACLILPSGNAFFSVPPFLDTRVSGTATGAASCIIGQGNTNITPLPIFNYSNCSTACVFIWSNGTNLYPNYALIKDWEVFGLGYTLTGAGGGFSVMDLTRVTLKNVWVWGWGTAIGTGIAFHEPVAAFNPINFNSGATGCSIGVGSSTFQVSIDQGYCQGGTNSASIGSAVTSGMEFGSPVGSATVVVSGPWSSTGDSFLPGSGTNDTVRIGAGGNANFNGAYIQAGTNNTLGAIDCNGSGANVTVQNSKIDGGSGGIAVRSVAGCNIQNNGNNTFVQGTFSLSGNNFAQVAETQTGSCTTNAATVTFVRTYQIAPRVVVSVTTSGSTGAQATATNTTTATIHCNGASDAFVATVIPNPF